ncbi:hypothetical protein EDB85DRAFT_1490196 [Lactarius pseudohatsudake]|nr:hypothetical protein EDB85DRAFT_1490196 [Lactarius pseudohatsudake]
MSCSRPVTNSARTDDVSVSWRAIIAPPPSGSSSSTSRRTPSSPSPRRNHPTRPAAHPGNQRGSLALPRARWPHASCFSLHKFALHAGTAGAETRRRASSFQSSTRYGTASWTVSRGYTWTACWRARSSARAVVRTCSRGRASATLARSRSSQPGIIRV